mgnify:CR=1 FL=1
MSKMFKTASTAMIAVGLAFLFRYIQAQGGSKLDILGRPSYYAVQNYWFVFVAGIAVLLFSLLGSFFSWFKEFDRKEEVLPNAGYASDQEIRTWVTGSDAEEMPAGSQTQVLPGGRGAVAETEVLGRGAVAAAETEVMAGNSAAETEVMDREGTGAAGRTELLPESRPSDPDHGSQAAEVSTGRGERS